MRSGCKQLIETLSEPSRACRLGPREWSELIANARAANLLGSLAERLRANGVPYPDYAGPHLEGALQLSLRQHRSVLWEANCLNRALAELNIPVLVLKGAAYVLAGLPAAQGRLFGDIDILVPRSALPDVEVRLMVNGWVSAKTDAYDQLYYRRWMHELPPMVNLKRGTVIDVHHTILPLTAASTPDASAIITRSRPVDGLAPLRIPCAEDLVIHSITHLMHEGEFHNALRDLNDVDTLLRLFGANPEFWSRLPQFADEHGLRWEVEFGLSLCVSYFDTPIPEHVFQILPERRLTKAGDRLLDLAYHQAIGPTEGAPVSFKTSLARFVLYLRAHKLRMPAPLLLRHLVHKATTRDKPGAATPETR